MLTSIRNKLIPCLPYIVLCLLFLGAVQLFDPFYSSDTHDFVSIAESIQQGHGYRWHDQISARREPVYVYFLATLFTLKPAHYLFAVSFNLLFLLASFYFFKKTLAVFFSHKKTQQIAEWLFILYVPHYLYAAQLLPETLFLLLFILNIYFFINKKYLPFAISAGVAIGTKGTFIVVPLTLIFIQHIIVHAYDWKGFIKKTIFVYMIIMFILAPWIIRNKIIFDKYIYASSGLSRACYMGNYWETRGDWADLSNTPAGKIWADPNYNDVESDKIVMAMTLDMIKQHPLQSLWLWIIKIPRYWQPIGYESLSTLNKQVAHIWFALYMIILILALYQVKHIFINENLLYLYSALLVFFGIHLPLSVGIARYHYQLIPIVIILATLTLQQLRKQS